MRMQDLERHVAEPRLCGWIPLGRMRAALMWTRKAGSNASWSLAGWMDAVPEGRAAMPAPNAEELISALAKLSYKLPLEIERDYAGGDRLAQSWIVRRGDWDARDRRLADALCKLWLQAALRLTNEEWERMNGLAPRRTW